MRKYEISCSLCNDISPLTVWQFNGSLFKRNPVVMFFTFVYSKYFVLFTRLEKKNPLRDSLSKSLSQKFWARSTKECISPQKEFLVQTSLIQYFSISGLCKENPGLYSHYILNN